jgi:hypothetical protein
VHGRSAITRQSAIAGAKSCSARTTGAVVELCKPDYDLRRRTLAIGENEPRVRVLMAE